MNLGTWKSLKSPIMQEIRTALKKKAVPGQPSLTRKESNRTWREDFLGVFSDEQKKVDKERKQELNNRKKQRTQEVEEG